MVDMFGACDRADAAHDEAGARDVLARAERFSAAVCPETQRLVIRDALEQVGVEVVQKAQQSGSRAAPWE